MLLKEYLISRPGSWDPVAGSILKGEIESVANRIQLTFAEAKIPKVVQYAAETEDHDRVIDVIVENCLCASPNALTIGYVAGSSRNNVTNQYLNPGVSAGVSLLKSPVFRLLHSMLGNESFLALVYQYEAVDTDSKLQLWGPITVDKFKDSKKGTVIRFGNMMQKDQRLRSRCRPLPSTAKACLKQIFPDAVPIGKVPKKFKKLMIILEQVLKRHRKHQYEYPYIFDSICGRPTRQAENILSMATPKSRVIRFLLVIIGKLFPFEHVGTRANSALLCSKISTVINRSANEKICITDICRGMKLTQIDWLASIPGKWNKQQFQSAQIMFESYMRWFVEKFLCKLVGAFFHVTEGSQMIKLLFYRHDDWNKVSNRFIRRYFEVHLNNLGKVDGLVNFTENENLVGRIKLLPKTTGFRTIAAPFKGSLEERYVYFKYENDIIRPINTLMQHLRTRRDSAPSVDGIVRAVAQYKEDMIAKHGSLPKLYAFKFDVRNAYDSVPVSLIRDIYRERLEAYSSSDDIVIRQYHRVDHGKLTYKFKKRMGGKIAPTDLGPGVYAERMAPIQLNKSDVYSFIDHLLDTMAIVYHGTTYNRKVGLFQGFHLSAVLFNMVYDAVVDYLHEAIPTDSDTRIFRLVDDFLILSPDMNVINRYRKLISRPIPRFNLQVNRLKTKLANDKLQFVALNLLLNDLSFVNDLDHYDCSPVVVSSFSKLYERLELSLQSRMTHALYSPRFNTVSAVHANVVNFFTVLMERFVVSYSIVKRKDKFEEAEFQLFLERLLRMLESHSLIGDIATKDSLRAIAFARLRSKRLI